MRLVHPLAPADAILTLGSFDPMAAVCAAELWKAGQAPVIIMSGGIAHQGSLLDPGWDRSEAEVFADAARESGVPDHAIILEPMATNTGENFAFTKTMMEDSDRRIERLLVVAKPYMTRRGFATGRLVWPNVDLRMQCEDISMHDYFQRDRQPERTVRALVGDMHRIMVYPKLGYQIEQAVPVAVTAALQALTEAGFGDRLVSGQPV
ncbi:YdcF family protein [Acidisoma cellulosilytica]|uniref:YdcF family protein n=1 Tax=Acidisoma cellulosilyticum TaxID=2802395 RepID=A0A963YYR5_9PROT|nr:YdcF family protein [Acidisoma cellulosilyticum]MCB8879619.1 YdcF family protein [Acidisoma cellulosilyticum]